MFGATDKLNVITDQVDHLPAVVILRLRNMNALDTTGLKALEELAVKLSLKGRHLVMCGLQNQAASLANQGDLRRHVGEKNLVMSLKEAIERANEILAETE